MYTPYVRITSGNVYTVLDSVAKNPLGTVYSPPVVQSLPTTTNGIAAPPVYKYVQYNSTSNPAVVANPAPVFYTDQTFTTVTGVQSEGLGLNFIAGYLLPNSTAISGFTAALLNTSYVWIQIGGFLAGAIVPGSTAVGDAIFGAAGNWTAGRIAANSAITNKIYGFATSAVSGGLSNLQLGPVGCFWGS